MKKIFVGAIWGDVRVCRWVVCLIDGYVVAIGFRHAILPRFYHFLILFVL